VFRTGLCTIGLIMAFGGGVRISAVAFDLVEEATQRSADDERRAGCLRVGSAMGWSEAWTATRCRARSGTRSGAAGRSSGRRHLLGLRPVVIEGEQAQSDVAVATAQQLREIEARLDSRLARIETALTDSD
jgi:hypothetical protein